MTRHCFLPAATALFVAAAALQVSAQTEITYQGSLMEAGQPANGFYDMSFSLWDSPSGGSQIGIGVGLGVEVADGVFTVQLNEADEYGSNAFDGSPRWLQINVNGTPLSPRQPLTAAPYALYAFSGPGSGGGFWNANGAHIYNTNSGNVGVGQTLGLPAYATLHVATERMPAGTGALYSDDLIVEATDAVIGLYSDGSGSRGSAISLGEVDANGLLIDKWGIGRNTSAAGSALYIKHGTDANYSANPTRFVLQTDGKVGIGTSSPGSFLDVVSSTASSGDNTARFRAPEIGSRVSHVHYGASGDWYIRSADSNGRVFLQDNGGNVGIGTTNTDYARLTVNGGTGTTGISGIGTYGVSGTATTETGYGGSFAGSGFLGAGNALLVWGDSDFGGVINAGSDIIANDNVGVGISSPSSRLHVLNATSTALANFSQLGTGGGVLINMTSGSNNNSALTILQNNDSVPALWVAGVTRTEILEITGADVAEKFPTSETAEIEPGTVMEIDPDHPGKLRIARGAYNRRVAGVVSGAGDIPLGAILGNLPGSEDAPPIALSGRVWVRCDASRRPIEPGDLLTTAGEPGHAMKVVDHDAAQGAIIGKAMTSLDSGRGLVLVLVSLQ